MEIMSENALLIVVVLAVIAGIFLRFKAYTGKDGERYRKMQMQGPFVPTSDNSKNHHTE
ncbi:hypothetical protein [Undibacterium sp. RuRC25W]|uniref:hypothetical protein n=1 Tax=Undibacterium sp. RuRC25W TaxID=3413047 RepID=UPI003BF4111D